ncbi:MAG: hypothetical protein IKY76_03090 [Alistipes sp.]|nr:hypothetical protein [Alistipes sp.]
MKITIFTLLKRVMVTAVAFIFCTILSASCSNEVIEEPATGGEDDKKEEVKEDSLIETGANLRFVKNSDGTYGIEIEDASNGLLASQAKPAIIRVKDEQGKGRMLQAGYKKVSASGGKYTCKVTISSSAGSKFSVTDVYSVVDDALYTVNRTVKVEKAVAEDRGFSSEFTLISAASGSAFSKFDLFAPGFLYRTNTYNNPYESNPDLKSGSFCFKEMQYGLPMFMAYSSATKKTISLSHINPEIKSGLIEKDCRDKWYVSASVQYGSLGAEIKNNRLMINYTYPSIAVSAPRSHPVKEGQSHTYTLALGAQTNDSYTDAAVDSYKQHFSQNEIELYNVDIKEAYKAQMQMFADLSAPIIGNSGKRAYGLPWSISLPDGKAQAYELQNGFVGRQASIAYQLMRYGKTSGDSAAFNDGYEMAKFWFSDEQLVDYGLPRSWWIQTEKIDGYYNKYIGDFWTYPSFTRCFTDGMEGLLDCTRLAEAYEMPEAEAWGAIIRKFGEFLLSVESAGDGSFYRAYQKDGKYLRDVNAIGPWENEQKKIQADSKTNTLIPVRLLVRLYEWSGDERYLNRAIQAGEYGYNQFYKELGTFIGGTPDNSNVVDKEAAVFAMYAFNALYQATGEKKWLDAAEYAAVCAFSYTYCYDFAIQGDDKANIFRNGGVSGYSLISAGAKGTDNFNANIYYELFKLYIATGEEFYSSAAQLLERNTKRAMDLDGSKGYAHRALLVEATTICDLTFSSVSTWLPWCGAANGEPMIDFYQAFGVHNISQVKHKSRETLLNDLNAVGAGGKPFKKR